MGPTCAHDEVGGLRRDDEIAEAWSGADMPVRRLRAFADDVERGVPGQARIGAIDQAGIREVEKRRRPHRDKAGIDVVVRQYLLDVHVVGHREHAVIGGDDDGGLIAKRQTVDRVEDRA